MRAIPFLLCSFLITAALGPRTANAVLPADQIVTYSIREEALNENGAVVFTVDLYIEADSQKGSQIGWLINEAVFTEVAAGGNIVWSKLSPNGSTLWWAEHQDTQNPVASEFSDPPTLTGTAASDDPQDPDLNYSLGTGTCDPTCQSMFGGDSSALTYEFTEVGQAEPIKEGDDEPVEIDGEQDPV